MDAMRLRPDRTRHGRPQLPRTFGLRVRRKAGAKGRGTFACTMCLLVIAYKAHPRFPLVVAANRDEFLDRPALPAHFWDDAPHVLAGQDARAGGTWMGVTTKGRFAALTNHRDLRRPRKEGPSRGGLVRLALDEDPKDHDTSVYEGFNLVYGAMDDLWYHNNIDGRHVPLEPGTHGLSNHLLDTPWPKVRRAKALMAEALRDDKPSVERIFGMLGDPTTAPVEELPDTGVGHDLELALSPILISMAGYGTRCSTVVLVDDQGRVTFEERSRAPTARVVQEFTLP